MEEERTSTRKESKQMKRFKRTDDVTFTVIAPKKVREYLRVKGAISGVGLCRESGQRLTESMKADSRTRTTRQAPIQQAQQAVTDSPTQE